MKTYKHAKTLVHVRGYIPENKVYSLVRMSGKKNYHL